MILLVDNAYLYKDNGGSYYSGGLYGNSFFQRYSAVFGKIRFTAKIKRVECVQVQSRLERVDLNVVEVIELPDFSGIGGLIRNIRKTATIIRGATEGCEALIIRMLQLEGIICWLFRGDRPYAVEVVNNVKTSSRYSGLFRVGLIALQNKIIIHAGAVSYVAEILQREFPFKGDIQAIYSNVELPDALIMEPKKYELRQDNNEISMIHLANTISGNSKGHFTILEIIEKLKNRGISGICYFIGEGPSVSEIQKKAESMGIDGQINFLGYISNKEQLLREMREKDVFIFPSMSEGMPRCVIEACAAGLPCLASNVGGIPEILPNKYLFNYDDVTGFVDSLTRLVKSPGELNKMSIENCERAKMYKKSRLDKVRSGFYSEFSKQIEGKNKTL